MPSPPRVRTRSWTKKQQVEQIGAVPVEEEPVRVEAPSGGEALHQVHPQEAQDPRVPKESTHHVEQEREGEPRSATRESPIRGVNISKRVGQEAWRPPSDLRRGLDFGGGLRSEEEPRDAGAEHIAEIPSGVECT